jgi:asparagine N-glycosylation enzyme membrane subunit Stt3
MLNEIFKIPFPGWYYLQSAAFLNPTLSLPLSVLTGIGFVKAYDFLKNRLHSSRKLMKANLHVILIATLLLPTFFLGVNTIVARTDVQTCRISIADYDAITWISNNTPKDAVIYNDHWVGTPSTWIPVISQRRIIMPLLSISEVGWSNMMFTRQDESIIVAKYPNSTEALSILRKYNVSYIYLSNNVSAQVEEWRDNYDAHLFLQSPHYELAFNEDNAWVIKVVY